MLLDLGVEPRSEMLTIYHGAIGGASMLEFLFQQEAIELPLNIFDKNAAVRWAVREQDASLLKLLLDRGCTLPRPDHFETLRQALRAYRAEVVESMLDALLNHGVDINAEDFGVTILWDAITRRDAFSLQLLLKRGANPLIRSRNNESPLSYTVIADFTEGARILLEAMGSMISPQDLEQQVYMALKVASRGSQKVPRVLERIYY